MKIFCIIPAYNEEKNIGKVIDGLLPLGYELVVVDDCSSDRTYEAASKKRVAVLGHIVNRGQGAALQTGMDYALMHGAEIIVHFDADGQFLAEEIVQVVDPIVKDEADIVFGSRFLEKKSEIPFFKKNFIMPLAKLVNRLFLGVKLSDPQSGFRALSRKAAEIIRIDQNRMAHCSEIMAKSFSSGLRIKEVPITVIYHDFGQKFSGGIRILKDLLYGLLLKK